MSGGFCTDCGHRVESFEGLSACPFCGTDHIPCSDDNQVNISVNWHELNIPVIWAERWAGQHREAEPSMLSNVYSIAHRLEKQFPERELLTLAGEVSTLRRMFPDLNIETNIPGVE